MSSALSPALEKASTLWKDYPPAQPFLAMAHNRQGHKEETEAALAKARRWLKENEGKRPWAELQEVALPLKEAERIIGGR